VSLIQEGACRTIDPSWTAFCRFEPAHCSSCGEWSHDLGAASPRAATSDALVSQSSQRTHHAQRLLIDLLCSYAEVGSEKRTLWFRKRFRCDRDCDFAENAHNQKAPLN